MAEIDKVKEQVGWSKVLFGLLIAVDVSLVAWIAQYFFTANNSLLLLATTALFVVTFAIVVIDYNAKRELTDWETCDG